MIIDFFDMISDVLAEFTSILSYFDNVKIMMETVISNISDMNIIQAVTPYIGTIRYVSGDTVYMTLTRTLQIGMFILLVRTLYEMVTMIINQLKAQKPLSFIKKFLQI